VSPEPLVSVVIPAYNAARLIPEAIDSVLAQTYKRLEVIVVDDGSTDDTRSRVRAYGGVRYVWQRNSGGVSAPRNHGLRVAHGDLVAFLDADDLMAPRRIETVVRVMSQHPDVALAFTNFQHFGPDGLDPIDHFQTCDQLRRHLAQAPPNVDAVVLSPQVSVSVMLTENFGCSAPVVRPEAIRSIGGYDEQLLSIEDYDCHLRVASRYPIAVIPAVLTYKRAHDGNMSANTERMLLTHVRVRARLLQEMTDPRHVRALRRMLAVYHASLAYHYTGRDNAKAFAHAFRSMRFRRRPGVRHFARILADLAGRDTHGSRARA